jgi:hypothetical protein
MQGKVRSAGVPARNSVSGNRLSGHDVNAKRLLVGTPRRGVRGGLARPPCRVRIWLALGLSPCGEARAPDSPAHLGIESGCYIWPVFGAGGGTGVLW